MTLIQILDCSKNLGTCCSDYGIVKLLDITRRIFDLFQLVVPILLIIMATISFIRLLVNPELKGGTKKIINQFLAAVFVFFLPTILNVVLGILPDTTEIGACWNTAKVNSEIIQSQAVQYISPKDGKKPTPVLVDPKVYEKGVQREGSATGKSIVAYARKFVGKKYVLGGQWDGEIPYTPTDCSGFVQGVFAHHGIKLKRKSYDQWADKSKFTLVSESQIKPGDVIAYDGHVGILTGKGKGMIHAASARSGIVETNNYAYRSHLGIMRIKGVN